MSDFLSDNVCDSRPTNSETPTVAGLGVTTHHRGRLLAGRDAIDRLESARFTHFRDMLEQLAQAVEMPCMPHQVSCCVLTFNDIAQLDNLIDAIVAHANLVGFPESTCIDIYEQLDLIEERLLELNKRIKGATRPTNPRTREPE